MYIRKHKLKGIFLILLVCIAVICIKKVVWMDKNNVYYIQNEGENYLAAQNAFCGEWEVLYSESVENEGEGCMKKGEIIVIHEDEVKIGDELLSDICFNSTLTTFRQGREYEMFFREYGYTCSCFNWIPEKDYYLYTMISNNEKQAVICMAEKDFMIIRYGTSVYYCKKSTAQVKHGTEYFSGVCREHDFGLDGGEAYEGRWVIDQIAAMRGTKKVLENENMVGEEIYFYCPDLGRMRILYNGKMYRKIPVRMDIIEKREGQKFDNYGSFEDLGVTDALIPYVQFDLSGTDIGHIHGILVVSDTEILLVTEEAVYNCSRSL